MTERADEDGFVEDPAPVGMTIVRITYQDPLNIERTVVESEETFRQRAAGKVGEAEIEEMALAFEDYMEEQFPHCSFTVEVETSEYTRLSHAVFASEAANAGLDVRRYQGRFGYDGPAVVADSVNEVIRHVSVPCQNDQMGRGVVVYPR